MAADEAKDCAWRFSSAQARRIVQALQLQGQRAEEILAEAECACADYHASADVESPKSGQERNLERKKRARQLRRLETAAKRFHEALSMLDGDAEDELRKEYRSAAVTQTEADQRFNARRVGRPPARWALQRGARHHGLIHRGKAAVRRRSQRFDASLRSSPAFRACDRAEAGNVAESRQSSPRRCL